MLDISKLSIMTREHSFNTIHQILNCFTNCFYLLFSLCLYCSLCRYFLGQLLVSWVKPFRAANRMFKTSALKINRNISVSLSRDKIQLLCQCHCQVFRRWWNSCIIYNPLGGTHNISFKWKTKRRTLNYSNSVELHILFWFLLTTLWSNRSSRSETELLNCDANEHICWQRLRSSNNAASRFKASAVLVRKLSKWMILLQRKVTWKSKQEWERRHSS